MIEIQEYVDGYGRNPFDQWIDNLDPAIVIRVRKVVNRMAKGHISGVKSVGGGVWEYRLHTGPGYRIYFGRQGDVLIILLGGGTKNRQHQDIKKAKKLWQEHKQYVQRQKRR